jgi:mannose-6-phosphate isomerase-like protein (cupin superfamily)
VRDTVTDAYTIMRALDAPDYTGDAPGAFHGYARPMGAEQIAFNLRILEPGTVHMPPGGDPTAGHAHATIEELYFVLEGEVTAKLGDDVVMLERWDAVLIPPETPRSVRNDSLERAAFALVSVKVADHATESMPVQSFWP